MHVKNMKNFCKFLISISNPGEKENEIKGGEAIKMIAKLTGWIKSCHKCDNYDGFFNVLVWYVCEATSLWILCDFFIVLACRLG